MRRQWAPIVDEAAEYAGGGATLRQVHYRLVSNPSNEYRNDENDYKQLSRKTAKARRQGSFPGLTDRTRSIEWRGGSSSVAEALSDAASGYQRNNPKGSRSRPGLSSKRRHFLDRSRSGLSRMGTRMLRSADMEARQSSTPSTRRLGVELALKRS